MRRPNRTPLAALLALLALPSMAFAALPGQGCTGIEDAAQRLACYDRALGRTGPASEALGAADAPPALTPRPPAATPSEPATSLLSSTWELQPVAKSDLLTVVPHRANYLLPLRYTTHVNALPFSPAPGREVSEALPLDRTEANFQLSLKVKALKNVLGTRGDLWLAYTQQSSWQLYNGGNSSPFRVSDYEPEVIFSLPIETELLGWRWRVLNLGFLHQSNGRALPLSRSWNRVYAEFGIERGPVTVLARPWLRLPEGDNDDNPDIRNYMGSGEMQVAYARKGHVLSLLGRYSHSGGRGGLQVDWAFPLTGSLKGFLQLTSGYGANLIDYNHSQSTIGVGLLLFPWQ